jgi:hypothetical protein
MPMLPAMPERITNEERDAWVTYETKRRYNVVAEFMGRPIEFPDIEEPKHYKEIKKVWDELYYDGCGYPGMPMTPEEKDKYELLYYNTPEDESEDESESEDEEEEEDEDEEELLAMLAEIEKLKKKTKTKKIVIMSKCWACEKYVKKDTMVQSIEEFQRMVCKDCSNAENEGVECHTCGELYDECQIEEQEDGTYKCENCQ